MSIPDYQTLMLPLLTRAATQEVRVPEIKTDIADQFNLTDDEREQRLRSGNQRVLENRLYWAKIYLSRAGLLMTPTRGRFIATDLGRELLSRKPERINNATLQEFPGFQDFYRRTRESNESSDGQTTTTPALPSAITPEEAIDAAYITLQSALSAELIQRILQNSPSFFEQPIVDLLVSMGYGGTHKNAAAQLGRSGDGGVDGIINEDRLGLDRVYVQAKRYAKGNTVGRPDVQAFVGSLVGLGASKGVFVTTSTFSSQAADFVRHLSQRVVLIDSQRLADLMIEHNVGTRLSRSVEFKRVDEDFFDEEI